MTLYHSTFRRFASSACTAKAVGQPYNWSPPSQLQHAKLCSCRCSASRHTTRRGGLRVPSTRDQAEKLPERKDALRKPLLPSLWVADVAGSVFFHLKYRLFILFRKKMLDFQRNQCQVTIFYLCGAGVFFNCVTS